LVGAIAHDIVNYLIVVRAYSSVLLEKAQEAPNMPDQEKVINSLKRIEQAGKNSSQLLAKLLQFSRKPKEKILPADINKIVDDALDLTGPMVKMADIVVSRLYTPNLPFVAVDKDEMQEVFVALILNSVDALPKKGVITIKTDRTLSGFVEIVFSDNGVGVKREDLDKIGEPFYTTKTPDKGVGMGLAIAYEVIARQKGKISVQSAPGKGTAFSILLPVALPKDSNPDKTGDR
jgi:signal transduction histidine kinase